VCPGETIQVGSNSRAVILILASNTPMVLDQNSEFVITQAPGGGGSLMNLLRGALLFISRIRQSHEIRTPFVNAAIEGTEFVIRVLTDRTVITVFEGAVRATNQQGTVVAGAGQQAVAVQGQAPQVQVIVRPRDAVQWALYYEPVLPADSFAQLAAVPEAAREATFYVRRAGLLLGTGQLDAARADLDQAQKLDPANGDAYALRTIVAVALNDNAGALDSGRIAVERAPKSLSARLALSYALQSNLQLEAARDAAIQATGIAPNDSAAWARLAELRLMLDDVAGAVEAARRGVTLSTQLGRAQSALGFALLAQLEPSDARAAFERAVELEPDYPLARLGLGLARIRQGRLAEGRSDLELAVALNPDSSLLRSYLGKAYFEEKREPLPAAEFDLAKQLDPNDPTPWFYDSIRKQTVNRPVEALQDLQRSIELNDNRAVYRSRLLLDQDLAARSAGLGRIYRDLGFEQLALAEGWNSVNGDATDHSGHRFLSDVYSALPRHEIARISELLQAQLLQPINVSAVQPQLAETNLSILGGSGPAEPAFNEFNSLFNRNRLSLLASGAAGGNDTLADEVVVSGVWNKVSFSAGQFHFNSDGFQENNAQERDIFNAFVQASLSPSISVQGEVRSTRHDRGDLQLRFDPAQLHPFMTQETDFDSARLGLRHAFSPRSDVIASFIYGRVDDRFDDRLVEFGFPGNPGSLSIDVGLQGWTTEVQHLYRSRRFRVVSGVGRFQADRDDTVDVGVRLPFPPFAVAAPTRRNTFVINHTNVYSYSQIDVRKNVTLSLGSSGDFLNGRGVDADQLNPKAGVSWQARRTTTLRAAGFRTLHRSLISNQTVEPTQVAGFNQLFDGVEGEAAWRYGVGVDEKLSRTLYAGGEVSWRNLVHPNVPSGGGEVVRDDWNERFGRAYLYSTPHARIGLSLEYLFERFERKGNFGEEQIVELSTHRIPLGLAYFHPSGVVARLKTTIVDQQGVFGTTDLPTPGEDRFAVVDGSIGYRLPKRYGLITLDARNLFDEKFMFQDTDPKFPRILPRRLVVFRFTVTM
jgi:tetratricopeptide (TPR) repeat protein